MKGALPQLTLFLPDSPLSFAEAYVKSLPHICSVVESVVTVVDVNNTTANRPYQYANIENRQIEEESRAVESN